MRLEYGRVAGDKQVFRDDFLSRRHVQDNNGVIVGCYVGNLWNPITYFGLDLADEWTADAGLTLVGSEVSSWAGKKSAFTFTGSAGSRPTREATGWNGKQSILFDGVSSVLRCDSMGPLVSGNDVPFTLLFAAQKTDGTSTAKVYWSFASSLSAFPYHAMVVNAGVRRITREDDAMTPVNADGGAPNTNRHIFGQSFSGTAVTLYVDGSTDIAAAALNVGVMTTNKFTLGAHSSGGSFTNGWMPMRVGAIMLVKRAITAYEMNSVRSYWTSLGYGA